MWAASECEALIHAVIALSNRDEIEEFLGRCYSLRSTETEHGIEYGGPGVGGWIRVRYHQQRAVSATFIERL
jgi:hypothetical protein